MTSKIKVDNVNKVSDDSNIINKCGTTITLGASGDSIALAAGATQTGFGSAGQIVDWQTGDIKTSTFTAVSGKGYFCNTAGGPFTCNLPAGSPGDIVGVVDYNNTFNTDGLTLNPNGTEVIGGGTAGDTAELTTQGQALTLVYVDAGEGWKPVNDSTSTVIGQVATYVTASATGCTGPGSGCIVDTNYKVHTFTGPGTFTVTCAGNCVGSNQVSYFIVAGGGEGGATSPSNGGGGGGAGGTREGKATACSYTASPIAACTGVIVTAQAYPIVVGGGGALQPSAGGATANDGDDSSALGKTSTGGGGGKIDGPAGNPTCAGKGGSGGGGAAAGCAARLAGGSGNTPSVSPPQGRDGGVGIYGSVYGGGGGGGAGNTGGNATSPGKAGDGAVGVETQIPGSPLTKGAGGGGGRTSAGTIATGGSSIGGNGGSTSQAGTSAAANTGSGGGSGGWPASSYCRGGGGSGIVVLRYRFQ